MGLNIKEYILDEAAVETVSADLQAYMQGLGADRKSTFAGIMIAFTMCSGILNVGDTMTLGGWDGIRCPGSCSFPSWCP